ncbi:MAG: 3-phosphoglycerate dehydrogenase [Betaproteobacteria bacterium]
MSDPVDSLVVDLVEWIGPEGRPYAEVIDAWRTSCPRLPVWEEANARGYLARTHHDGAGARVSVTPSGRDLIAARRKSSAPGCVESLHVDA